MKWRATMQNIPGTIRAIDRGNGICELQKEPDVLCVIPQRRNKAIRKLIMSLGTAGIIGGVAAALILAAPALGIFVFALLAWCLFAAWATGEQERRM